MNVIWNKLYNAAIRVKNSRAIFPKKSQPLVQKQQNVSNGIAYDKYSNQEMSFYEF